MRPKPSSCFDDDDDDGGGGGLMVDVTTQRRVCAVEAWKTGTTPLGSYAGPRILWKKKRDGRQQLLFVVLLLWLLHW